MPSSIKFLYFDEKLNYTFRDKSAWLNLMGYYDYEETKLALKNAITKAYCNGNYKLRVLDKHGYQINIEYELPGANERQGQSYKLNGGFVVYSYGKLKCTTFLGGKLK